MSVSKDKQREIYKRYKEKPNAKALADAARKRRQDKYRAQNSKELPKGHKVCPRCKTYKSFEEFQLYLAAPDGRQNRCRECVKLISYENKENNRKRSAKHYYENREVINEHRANLRLNNPQKYKEISKRYRTQNPEKHRQASINSKKKRPEYYRLKQKEWESNNRDRVCAKSKRWRDKNPAKCRQQNATYFGAKENATPEWADNKKVAKFYEECAFLNQRDGIHEWHVDHIVPLRSKKVCGLHNEFNLRVIRRSENCQKSNSWWPDMPKGN